MSFLKELTEKNKQRQLEWDINNDIGVLFKAVEFVGEVGELCNNIKKLEREKMGLDGSRCLLKDLKDEFGDVLISLSLLAQYYDIDLEEVTKNKFNKTSNKMNFNTKFTLPFDDMVNKIKATISDNKFTVGDLYNGMNYVPTFKLGRQIGKSTAIRKFAKDNPDLDVAVFVNSMAIKKEHEQLAATLLNLKYYYESNSIRGMKVDYIILDECTLIDNNALVSCNPDSRILQINSYE